MKCPPFCSLLTLITILWLPAFSQQFPAINPADITIARDSFGVPHIFAPTDEAAAYGLAWAEAEDAFATMQEPVLAVHGRLARIQGKDGVIWDMCAQLFGVKETVDERYDKDISPQFRKVLDGFVQGVNAYAAAHPHEVLDKSIFPLVDKDVLMGYALITAFMSNVPYDLLRLFKNQEEVLNRQPLPGGSNAFAMNPSITDDGTTWLVSNSHQPHTGFTAWYEVHVQSDEGWNILGATFPGGVTPFVGTGNDFGWTHTTNYDDYCDMYRLTVRDGKTLEYLYDGEWKPLEEEKARLRVKIGPVIVPVTRKYYRCIYGPVLKNKNGYFALRFPAMFRIGAPEQWYHLNKATDYNSFMAAVNRMQTPNQNIVYADKQGTIFFMGYALFPYRDPAFRWRGILPGDTSATLWEPHFKPLDSLVFVKNPPSGYVFNNNNSSLHCTALADNPDPARYGATLGLQAKHTARSIRVEELMTGRSRMSYTDLKTLKYDSKLPIPLYTRTIENLDVIRHLSPDKYPDIADAIAAMAAWNGSVTADNRQAALFAVALHSLIPYLRDNAIPDLDNTIPEELLADALRDARRHLLRHFGRIDVPLGEVQRHVRGDVSLPVWGVPEAITQMYTEPWKKGMFHGTSGESFILFATYDAQGLSKLETINCFGASSHPDSPHYTDQMEMFVNKQLKHQTLDKTEILRKAERVYHPQ